jgi:hypothetical protein
MRLFMFFLDVFSRCVARAAVVAATGFPLSQQNAERVRGDHARL